MSPTVRRSVSARRDDVHDRSPVEHRDAIAERLDLVEVGGDQDDRRAAIAVLAQRPVHVLRGADVEADGGVDDHQDLRVLVELARQHHLLLVAAAAAPRCACRSVAPRMSKAAIACAARERSASTLTNQRQRPQRRRPVVRSARFQVTGKLGDQRGGRRILGHVGHPERVALERPEPVMSSPSNSTRQPAWREGRRGPPRAPAGRCPRRRRRRRSRRTRPRARPAQRPRPVRRRHAAARVVPRPRTGRRGAAAGLASSSSPSRDESAPWR